MRETIHVRYQPRRERRHEVLPRDTIFRGSPKYRPTDEETSAIAALRDQAPQECHENRQ